VFVAFPTIDSVGNTIDIVLYHRLAKREERETVVYAQLYQQLRANSGNEIVSERKVINPSAENHPLGFEPLQ
jgi:hypothetical protein